MYGALLSQQPEAFDIVLGPAGLLNHALQCLAPKGAPVAVEDHGNPPPVRVVINLVRTVAALIPKPVADEGGDHFARGEVTQQPVVDAHRVRQ
jgi:hypothetical protein